MDGFNWEFVRSCGEFVRLPAHGALVPLCASLQPAGGVHKKGCQGYFQALGRLSPSPVLPYGTFSLEPPRQTSTISRRERLDTLPYGIRYNTRTLRSPPHLHPKISTIDYRSRADRRRPPPLTSHSLSSPKEILHRRDAQLQPIMAPSCLPKSHPWISALVYLVLSHDGPDPREREAEVSDGGTYVSLSTLGCFLWVEFDVDQKSCVSASLILAMAEPGTTIP